MRVRVTIDDELLEDARRLTGLVTTELVHVALKALVARESAKQLALLGGSEPDFEVPPRERSEES